MNAPGLASRGAQSDYDRMALSGSMGRPLRRGDRVIVVRDFDHPLDVKAGELGTVRHYEPFPRSDDDTVIVVQLDEAHPGLDDNSVVITQAEIEWGSYDEGLPFRYITPAEEERGLFVLR